MIVTKLHPSQLNTINTPSDENVLTFDLTTGLLRWRATTVSGAFTTFLELTDTPSSFISDKWLKVNPAGTALVLTDAPSGGGGSSTFLELTDTPASYIGYEGYLTRVNALGTTIEFVDSSVFSGGGGATTFLELTDTPSSFVAGQWLRVNSGGDALELVTAPVVSGGSGATAVDPWWGFGGALASGVDMAGPAWISPRTGTIEYVSIYCGNTGTVGNTIVDIHKNGTTIFTTQSNRPVLPYNDIDQIVQSVTPDIPDILEGDILSVFIDDVATGAEDLSVLVKLATASGGGGVSSFIALTDTPSDYTGQAGGFMVVNQEETGLEFTTIIESEQTLRYAFFLGAG